MIQVILTSDTEVGKKHRIDKLQRLALTIISEEQCPKHSNSSFSCLASANNRFSSVKMTNVASCR